MSSTESTPRCEACDGDHWQLVASFSAPPPGENAFGASAYCRRLWRCGNCGHFVNRHDHDLSRLYSSAYAEASYDGDRRAERFRSILALPPERSDNHGRAAAIMAFASDMGLSASPRLLDVGSGMAVFPAVMRKAGWRVTAVDPDPANARQARELADAEAITGEFSTLQFEAEFDVVTLNKVLEHVVERRAMLIKAAGLLSSPAGFLYVEVPDGEAALDEGPGRQEFFLEHYCAYSPASLALVAARAGLRLRRLDRLREPSGKFTLRAFLTRRPTS